MRKIVALLSIVLALSACNSGTSTDVKNDSTVVKSDTVNVEDTAVTVIDSVKVSSEVVK